MPQCQFCEQFVPFAATACPHCGAPIDKSSQTEAAARTSPPIEEPLEDQIVKLLSQGRKLQAIKLYREQTGAGLKDSKEAVEQLAAQQGLHHLKLASPGIGCVGMLVSLFVFVLIVVAVLGLLAVFGFGA